MLLTHWPVAVNGIVCPQTQRLRPLLWIEAIVQTPDVDVAADIAGCDPLVVHGYGADEHLVLDDPDAGRRVQAPEPASPVPGA